MRVCTIILRGSIPSKATPTAFLASSHLTKSTTVVNTPLAPFLPFNQPKLKFINRRNYSRITMSEAKGSEVAMKPVEAAIRAKLIAEFEPLHLEIENESYKHSVPRGSESHFKVIVVSEKFNGLPLLKQHQLVNTVLKEELSKSIHALAIKTATPDKWREKGEILNLETPNCLGGSKGDAQFKKQ